MPDGEEEFFLLRVTHRKEMGSQIKAGLTPLSWEILSGDYKENLRDQISAHCQEMGGMLGEVPDHRPIAQKVDKLPEKKKKLEKKFQTPPEVSRNFTYSQESSLS